MKKKKKEKKNAFANLTNSQINPQYTAIYMNAKKLCVI